MKSIFLLLALLVVAIPVSAGSLAGCPAIEPFLSYGAPDSTNIAAYEAQGLISTATLETTCNQTEFLKQLVTNITKNGTTQSEKVALWTNWIQKITAHDNLYQPVDTAGYMVTSPVWLLQNRFIWCGQAARLSVDAMHSIGIPARVVQLTNHQVAEAYTEGRWHLIDGDLIGPNELIYTPSGKLASVNDIRTNNSLIAGLISHKYDGQILGRDLPNITVSVASTYVPSVYNGMTTPYTYYKTATESQCTDYRYGWGYTRTDVMEAPEQTPTPTALPTVVIPAQTQIHKSSMASSYSSSPHYKVVFL